MVRARDTTSHANETIHAPTFMFPPRTKARHLSARLESAHRNLGERRSTGKDTQSLHRTQRKPFPPAKEQRAALVRAATKGYFCAGENAGSPSDGIPSKPCAALD